MHDYLMLIHNDPVRSYRESDWEAYIQTLVKSGTFRGSGVIGSGVCRRKSGTAPPITARIGSYIRLHAESLAEVESLLAGNPVFENGGTVELRELSMGT